MFSNLNRLQNRTKKDDGDRYEYLQHLVTEFQDTDAEEAKEQILANLANFAYDPINYIYLRNLHVVDLFIDNLSSQNENFILFSLGGLCNLCLDIENRDIIQNSNGIPKIINCLSLKNEEIVLNTITTLIYLITPDTKSQITCEPVKDAMMAFSRSNNKRISNLASVFVTDHCT